MGSARLARSRADGLMARWTRLMLRWRWLVIGFWLVALVASFAAMSGLSDLLTNRFTLPGSDTAKTEHVLEQNFGQRPDGSFLLVAQGPAGSAPSLVPGLRAAAGRAAAALPTGRVASVTPVSDRVASAVIVTRLEQVDAETYTKKVRRAAGAIPGATLFVTGQAAINNDLDPVFS